MSNECCKVCDGPVRDAFTQTVLRKFAARFVQCTRCGLLQASDPHWLAEAYSNDALVMGDTGILERNAILSKVCAVLFWRMFGGRGRFLDAAGGYGVFTRLMRDLGYDCYWSDPYATNVFARGFEGSLDEGGYSAVTAFEVLEHVADPRQFLMDLRTRSGASTLVLSTETFPGPGAPPLDWWYYGFSAGQHISFYTPMALQILAEKLGLKLYSRGSIHVMTDRRLSALDVAVALRARLAAVLCSYPRWRLGSKVMLDHEQLVRN